MKINKEQIPLIFLDKPDLLNLEECRGTTFKTYLSQLFPFKNIMFPLLYIPIK